jgi:hypothetical protein
MSVVGGAEPVTGAEEELPVELHATKAMVDKAATADMAAASARRDVDMCSTLRNRVPTDGQHWVSVR